MDESGVLRRQFDGAAMAGQAFLMPVNRQQGLATANQKFPIIRA